MEVVRLENCAKSYDGVIALNEISLSIEKGQFATLLGPSGSGKTTILSLIAGMIKPTTGRVFIGGNDVTEEPPSKRGLGMVFQNYALMPHMTVFENIAFPLRVRRMPRREINLRVAEVLNIVRLPDIGDRKPRELSGGQQQRVSLARCIAYKPDIILMDEPLGALDKKLREEMELEIKRIHRELGVTMLCVTHDQEEALTMSDRIILLNSGRIEQDGSPTDLYHRPVTPFVANFVGHSNVLEARVEMRGSPARLRTGSGYVLISNEGTCAEVGKTVQAMVRPENVVITSALNQDLSANTIPATLVDSIVLGSAIRHHVRTAAGENLTAVELNRPGHMAFRKGDPVAITWRDIDIRILEGSILPSSGDI